MKWNKRRNFAMNYSERSLVNKECAVCFKQIDYEIIPCSKISASGKCYLLYPWAGFAPD